MSKSGADISLKKGVPNVRHDITFRLTPGAQSIRTQHGEQFLPAKVMVSHWIFEGKAFAEVSGRTGNGQTRSKRFSLIGTSGAYAPCPNWLLELIREAGFRQEVEQA